MSSYKIYLTKSSEVAGRIAKSFGGENRTADIGTIGHGHADGKELIPATYYGKGYFYCIVELKPPGENGENYAPTYELTIC